VVDFSMSDQLSGSLLQDVDLKGLDNMKLDLSGGTKTTLAGGAKIDSDAKITLEPVTTTSTITLEPVTTSSTVDLKPVAVDTCVRLELGALPATDIHTPYEQRWAIEFLGVELLAFKLSGETTTSVRPARRAGTVFGLDKHADADHDCGCGCGGGSKRQPHRVVLSG
jgi:hypothetical protein